VKVLLDTQVLIWWLEDNPALNEDMRGIIADPQNRVCASTASLWEVGIKHAIGKLAVHPDILRAGAEKSGIDILNVTPNEAVRVANVPLFEDHRDPFDRMLVTQALIADLTLITADSKIRAYQAAYGITILWAKR
jgi:PIN domain nuclease of toxin-antitoxin system